MYLKRIQLENVGPINSLDISFPFNEQSKPKPVVFVGENGSGKSILVSYIVNALLSAQQFIFENTEVEKGKVYKYRSPNYIKTGNQYSFGKIDFEKDLTCFEWQLTKSRKDFEKEYDSKPTRVEWNKIPEDNDNFISNNFNNQKKILEEIFNHNCILYFPPNRFEEPAWLNLDNLNARAAYSDIKHLKGFSNRRIINYSPLQINKNWLLDILFDRSVLETKVVNVPVPQGNKTVVPLFAGFSGECTNIYESLLLILRKIIQKEGNIRFGIGIRSLRNIQLMLNEKSLIPNIFQLSTGETTLLNLFLTILRDFDLCSTHPFPGLDKVRGIVLVDEIDIHLHSIHQRQVLPELIQLFPEIQFIVTSHSPLFILGLENILGKDGVSIFQLPDGIEISSDQFSEFDKAYHSFKNTKRYDNEIRSAVENTLKPILFVEGDHDIRYIRKASDFLGKFDILNKLQIFDSEGYGDLNNIWKHFNTKLAEVFPQKIILLYDCDIKKNDSKKENIFLRVIPKIEEHPIKKGIENLFKKETLDKACEEKNAFIDKTSEHECFLRGEKIKVSEIWQVNEDEKGNLCDWLCEKGTKEDFERFSCIFEIIEAIVD